MPEPRGGPLGLRQGRLCEGRQRFEQRSKGEDEPARIRKRGRMLTLGGMHGHGRAPHGLITTRCPSP